MFSGKFWISVLLALAMVAGSSVAAPIEVVNPSFENYVLAQGYWTWHGEGLTGEGWQVEAGAAVGVFRPSQTVFSTVPDGVNTAYSQGAAISQVLPAFLVAGTTYTLTVAIGNPANIGGFPGYRVELWAGTALLAADDNSLTPAQGEFETSSILYVSPPGDPHAGQSLEIRLLAFGAEVNFDLVRLQDNEEVAAKSTTWGKVKTLYRP